MVPVKAQYSTVVVVAYSVPHRRGRGRGCVTVVVVDWSTGILIIIDSLYVCMYVNM